MMELRASRMAITLSSSQEKISGAVRTAFRCSATDQNGKTKRTALIGEDAARALIDLADLPVPRVRWLYRTFAPMSVLMPRSTD